METNLKESKIYIIETEKQAVPVSSNRAKILPTTVKAKKVSLNGISGQKS